MSPWEITFAILRVGFYVGIAISIILSNSNSGRES